MKRLLSLFLLLPLFASAAPFAEWLQVPVPGGGTVSIWGEGDEYDAYFETADGHALRVNGAAGRYEYVTLDERTEAYVGTGVFLGDEAGNEALLASIPLHLRDESEAHAAAVQAKIDALEEELHIRKNWEEVQAATERRRELEALMEAGEYDGPLPTSVTVGSIVGVTLLVDFPVTNGAGQVTGTLFAKSSPLVTPDVVKAWFNQEEVFSGGGYSVRKFYAISSGGQLDYTNVVVGPVCVPHPREYYDKSNTSCGTCGRNMIRDALSVLVASPDYQSVWLPLIRRATTGYSGGGAKAFNVIFAGPTASTWDYGLWAHKSSVSASDILKWTNDQGNSCYFSTYNIVPANNSTSPSTTLHHENGHMICGFPDLYHYNNKTYGVGNVSMMCHHTWCDVDPYLREGAGWYTPKTLPSSGWVTVTTDRDDVYRFTNASRTSERFYIQNRPNTGLDKGLSNRGILIYRANASRSNTYASKLSSYNSGHASTNRYDNELSLEQADGKYDLERRSGWGSSVEANDYWFDGNTAPLYADVFDNDSAACSRWYDGTSSGLKLSHFSKIGDTMRFLVGDPAQCRDPVAWIDFAGRTLTSVSFRTKVESFGLGSSSVSVVAEFGSDAAFSSVVSTRSLGTVSTLNQTQTWTVGDLARGTKWYIRLKLANSNGRQLSEAVGLYEPLSPDVLYVKKGGAGARDGSSWANAFPDISDALDAMAAEAPIFAGVKQEAWVAAGTYVPDQSAPQKFYVSGQGYAVYGGFAGNETSRDQRDWIANPTILSGEVGDPNDPTDNLRTVLVGTAGSEENVASLWDGFVVRDTFCGSMSETYGAVRGGVSGYSEYTWTNALTLSHFLFTANVSTGQPPPVAHGPVIIRDSVLTGNSSTYSPSSTWADPGCIARYAWFQNCTIAGNSTLGVVLFRCRLDNSIVWGNSFTKDRSLYWYGNETGNTSPLLYWFDGYGSDRYIAQTPLPPKTIGTLWTSDPSFVADADNPDFEWALGAASPAIDAGNTPGWMTDDSLDYLGRPRVSGAAPDLGAVEYVDQGPTAPRFSSVALGEVTYRSVAVAATLRTLGNQSTSASLVAQVSPNASFSTIVATGTAVSATETKVAYTVSAAGLSDGTTYYVRVKATGSNGLSEFSEALSFTTADRAIPSGSATLGTPTLDTLPVSWRLTNVGYGNSSATVTILYGTTSACTQSKVVGTYTAETSGTAMLTGLSPNATYYVRIKVVASPSNKSFTSDPAVSAKTRDYGSPAVSATAGSASQYAATFTWTLSDLGYGASSAAVYVDVSKSSSFPSGSTTTSTLAADATSTGSARPGAVSGLDPETTYYVRVRAVNDGGKTGTSATMTFATKAVGTPAAAVSVTERLQRGATLRIVVTDLGETANSATVYVDYGTTTSYGTTKTAGTISEAGTLDCQITELESETDYCVRVRVVNNGGKTGSATTTFKTLEPNDPAFTLSVSPSYTSASFTANITRIGEGASSAAGYVRWGASSAISPELGRIPFGRVASVPAEVSVAATGLSAGTTYYYEAVITNNITGRKAEPGSFSTQAAGDLEIGTGYYEPGLIMGYRSEQWPNYTTDQMASMTYAASTATRALGAISAYARKPNKCVNALDSREYSMSTGGIFTYDGELFMEAGRTYRFASEFFKQLVVVVDGEPLIKQGENNGGSQSFGSVAAESTGWHPIRVVTLGDNNGNGYCGGGTTWANTSSPFYAAGIGLAWTTNDNVTSVTTGNVGSWHRLMDAGDRHLLRARGRQAPMAFLDQGATFGSTTMRVPVRLDTMYDNLTLAVYASTSPNGWYFEDRWEKKIVVGSTGAAGAKTLEASFSGIDTTKDWYVSARLSDGANYDQWTDPVKFTPVIVRDPPAGSVAVGTPTFSSNTATVDVTSLGDDATSVSVVLEWSTASDFSTKETSDLGAVSAPGSKAKALSGLAAGTTYYVRAVLTGSPSGLSTTTAAAFFTTEDIHPTAWFDVKWGSQGWGSGAAWRTSAGETAAGGTWSVPSGDASSRSGSLLALGLPEVGVLRFTARSPSASKATVKVEGSFAPELASTPPDPPAGALAGLCFARGGYKGWNGSQWVPLTGATPVAASTAWTATFDWSQAKPRVRFTIGGTVLTASGSEWIPLATSQGYVTGVGYAGGGAVGDFKASYTGGGYVAPVLATLEDGGHVPLAFGKDASNNPTFEVTIKNAAKDAWYTVYASDTVDGAYKAVTSVKAAADGLMTLSISAPSSKPALFVRIGVGESAVPAGTSL